MNRKVVIWSFLVLGGCLGAALEIDRASVKVAPPSSEWNPAPPIPLELNLFDSGKSNTPVLVVDKNLNIYVYGKWIADTNGLRP